MLSRALSLATVTLLIGCLTAAAVWAVENLEAGKSPAQIFAGTCNACHKSPRGLLRSVPASSLSGFLRQHYTTGPEMSAAMAAYLVAAGSAPPEKKGPTAAEAAAAKTKSRKGEQLAAQPQAESADAIQHRTLRGKQRQAKEHEEPAASHPAPAAEDPKQTAALGTAAAPPASAPAPTATEPLVVLDIPPPSLPEGPPADLVQSYFSSSPVP